MKSRPRVRAEWPEALVGASAGALCLAATAPLWPALVNAVAALCALAAAAFAGRLIDSRDAVRRPPRGALLVGLAGIGGGWAAFFLLAGIPFGLNAAALAAGTSVAAAAAQRFLPRAVGEGGPSR